MQRQRGHSVFGEQLPERGWHRERLTWPGHAAAHRLLRQECRDQVVEARTIAEEDKGVIEANFNLFMQSISLDPDATQHQFDLLVDPDHGSVYAVGERGALSELQLELLDHVLVNLDIEIEYSDADRQISEVQIELSHAGEVEQDLPVTRRASVNLVQPLGEFIMAS